MEILQAISKNLKDRGLKISTAESCTAGYISNLLTSIPDSSDYFEGGIVVYSNKSKINVLGVEKELIEEHTEVSAAVACRMAERVKDIMGTEYSIATTGYADPKGYGTEENPAGTIYFAISSPEGTTAVRLNLEDTRARNIYFVTMEILDILKNLIETPLVL